MDLFLGSFSSFFFSTLGSLRGNIYSPIKVGVKSRDPHSSSTRIFLGEKVSSVVESGWEDSSSRTLGSLEGL